MELVNDAFKRFTPTDATATDLPGAETGESLGHTEEVGTDDEASVGTADMDVDEVSGASEPEGSVQVQNDTELVFTTDNAPAVAKAMDICNVTRVPCCAHVTSLAVKRVNSNVAGVKKWKKNVVNIVGNFRHSNANMKLLMDKQEEQGVSRPKKP